ncbi:MAG: hypothetical protein WCT85_03860 [Parachlamydiales bacterium]|jgi:hypothetical protein
MDFKTKYNRGDSVWFIDEDIIPKERKITGIEIRFGEKRIKEYYLPFRVRKLYLTH